MSAERDIVELIDDVRDLIRGENVNLRQKCRDQADWAHLVILDHWPAKRLDALKRDFTRLRESLAQSPEDAEWLRGQAELLFSGYHLGGNIAADRLEAIANRLSGVRECGSDLFWANATHRALALRAKPFGLGAYALRSLSLFTLLMDRTDAGEDEMTRKVHLISRPVINLGHTRTHCGRTIHYLSPDADLTEAVIVSPDFDFTRHGTLVTCGRCVEGTFQQPRAIAMETRRAETTGSVAKP